MEEWKALILDTLKKSDHFQEMLLVKNDSDHKIIADKLDKLSEEVIILKIKAGVWGGIAGLIVSCIPFVLYFLKIK